MWVDMGALWSKMNIFLHLWLSFCQRFVAGLANGKNNPLAFYRRDGCKGDYDIRLLDVGGCS